AAEAMTLARRSSKAKSNVFFVADDVLPQTLEVLRTRAEPLGIELCSCSGEEALEQDSFGVLLQYPGVNGVIRDYREWVERYRARSGGIVCVATDLLALTLLTPPGEWGADIVVGNTQRFG
ncbi:glycine dehydrogenase (aminomethyl-transferring), partial [Lysobacter sp. D1-1-M9]